VADEVEVHFVWMDDFRVDDSAGRHVGAAPLLVLLPHREEACMVALLNHEESYRRLVVRIQLSARRSYGLELVRQHLFDKHIIIIRQVRKVKVK